MKNVFIIVTAAAFGFWLENWKASLFMSFFLSTIDEIVKRR